MVLWAIAVWGGAMAVMGLAVGLAPWATRAMLGLALGMLVIGGAADMASAAFRQSILLSATDDARRGRRSLDGGPPAASVATHPSGSGPHHEAVKYSSIGRPVVRPADPRLRAVA